MGRFGDSIRLQNWAPDNVEVFASSGFSLFKHRLERRLDFFPIPTFCRFEKSLNIWPNFDVVTLGQAAQNLVPVFPELAQFRCDNFLRGCGRATVTVV